MKTIGCNKEENWWKIGLLANNCKKKGKHDKEIRQMINKFRWPEQVWERYDAVQLPVYKMKNSCIFNSPPNSMSELYTEEENDR